MRYSGSEFGQLLIAAHDEVTRIEVRGEVAFEDVLGKMAASSTQEPDEFLVDDPVRLASSIDVGTPW